MILDIFLIVSQDRLVRIETGYGLEGTLPDVICQRIIQDIVIPAFKAGQYSKGIKEGVSTIASLVAKEYKVTITGQEDQIYDSVHSDLGAIALIVLVIFIMVSILIMWRAVDSIPWSRGSWGRQSRGYWYGGSGHTGGLGGAGGFGGGFGGFGGGLSGGGGATGRW